MSQRGLEALLRPKSIAVIGASMKPNRAGYLMMRNLLAGGFNGPVLPVTPARKRCWVCWHGRILPACPLHPTLRFYVPMPAVILLFWKSSARKAVKPALFFPPRHRNTKISAPAPCAITCACLDQTVRVYWLLARSECQLFACAD